MDGDSTPAARDTLDSTAPLVLCVGGEDHRLRIPFMLLLREQGYRVTAAATDDAAPFQRAGITYHKFRFERFVNPLADRAAMAIIGSLLLQTRPAIVQTFDTKPNILVPLAARGIRNLQVGVTTRVVRRCPELVNRKGILIPSSYPPQAAPRNFSWAARSGRKVPFCWASPLQS